jgi:NAD kinase
LNKKGFVVDEKAKINVKILREEGWLIRDNDESFIDLKPGDAFKVYTSKEKAKFIYI